MRKFINILKLKIFVGIVLITNNTYATEFEKTTLHVEGKRFEIAAQSKDESLSIEISTENEKLMSIFLDGTGFPNDEFGTLFAYNLDSDKNDELIVLIQSSVRQHKKGGYDEVYFYEIYAYDFEMLTDAIQYKQITLPFSTSGHIGCFDDTEGEKCSDFQLTSQKAIVKYLNQREIPLCSK